MVEYSRAGCSIVIGGGGAEYSKGSRSRVADHSRACWLRAR